MVDISHVTGGLGIRIGVFLQTLENCFKVSIDDEGNLEFVLPTVECHKRIPFGHVYPNHFVVCTTFEMFVPGLFTVESLKTVQTEVVFVMVFTVTTSE